MVMPSRLKLFNATNGAIGNSGNGNWKYKMENRSGQNLMQMNLRVKPLIKDHLLKTTTIQRPHRN